MKKPLNGETKKRHLHAFVQVDLFVLFLRLDCIARAYGQTYATSSAELFFNGKNFVHVFYCANGTFIIAIAATITFFLNNHICHSICLTLHFIDNLNNAFVCVNINGIAGFNYIQRINRKITYSRTSTQNRSERRF